MPRFFCEPTDIAGEKITITGDDAHHMRKVLRMRTGEAVTVCDKAGFDYDCVVSELLDGAVTLEIQARTAVHTEPKLQLTLYQGMPKSDKMDFIVQKAVELGVTRIVPMQTAYCVAKADKNGIGAKLTRLNKIAYEAAKQAGRGIIPTVEDVVSFKQALADTADCRILYYEHGGITTSRIVREGATTVSICIGSEGGFSTDEVAQAEESGLQIGSLGSRILRCETAPIVAAALVLAATGEM